MKNLFRLCGVAVLALAMQVSTEAIAESPPTEASTKSPAINSDPTQGWALIEEGDRMTGKTMVFGTVASNDRQTRIFLGCWTRDGSVMAVSIKSNKYLSRSRFVQYRVDQNPMERAPIQTPPRVTLIPDSVRSQLESGTAKTMLVGIGGEVIEFPVGQFKAVYEGAQKACQAGNGMNQ